MRTLKSKTAGLSLPGPSVLNNCSLINGMDRPIFRVRFPQFAQLGAFTLAIVMQDASAQNLNSSTEVDTPVVEEIVIVDTRLNTTTYGVGNSLSVSSTELEKIQPVDAEQLFQRLPGFTVSRPGGAGGVSEIFLRGAESNFTAVYVDGVRVNNSANTRGGSFDFSMLDLFGVGQLDVATGAMSAIYGADAMAGVIRIRSAWEEPGSSSAIAEAGTAHDWRTGISTSFQAGDNAQWNLRASATDGGDDVAGSTLRSKHSGSRLAGRWNDKGSWEINARHVVRERTGYPEVSGGPLLAVYPDLERARGDEVSISAAADWAFTDRWISDVYLSSTRINDDVFTPAVAPGVLDAQPAFAAITAYRRDQFVWVNRLGLGNGLNLVAGLDSINEEGTDSGFVDFGVILPNAYTLDRSIGAAFAELGKDWGNGLVSTLAVRLDDDGDDRRASGKLGIERQFTDLGSRAWVRIANGFKLPSFFALGNPLFGNPDLVEERVRNMEAGFTYIPRNDAEFVVSVYDSRFVDLVDFDFETFSNINRGQFDVNGVELKIAFALTSEVLVQVDGNVADISSSAGPLRRRPEKTAGFTLDWSPDNQWALNVSARYMGSRLITSIPTGDQNEPGSTLMGVTASYTPKTTQRYWLAIDNVWNTNFQDAPGFPAAGRRLRVGTKIQF
jgi:vitamin B12 transporter